MHCTLGGAKAKVGRSSYLASAGLSALRPVCSRRAEATKTRNCSHTSLLGGNSLLVCPGIPMTGQSAAGPQDDPARSASPAKALVDVLNSLRSERRYATANS